MSSICRQFSNLLAAHRHFTVQAILASILLATSADFGPVMALEISGVASETGSMIHLLISNMSLALGERLLVTGRLTNEGGAIPIPLVNIRIQYFYERETVASREVMLLTQTPGGNFEDNLNSSSLGRVGAWTVVVRFDGGRGYASTTKSALFNIKARTTLTLQLSGKLLSEGQFLTIEGSLFPCLACPEGDLLLILVDPNVQMIRETLKLTPQGAPYSIGLFNYSLSPRVQGVWKVEARWSGNRASLPASSDSESFTVVPLERPQDQNLVYILIMSALLAMIVVVLVLWRRTGRGNH